MGYKDYFKDKKITVMGLGLLGRGVGDVEFLSKQGAILTVTDLKTKEELGASSEQLKAYNISYVLGEHKLENFRNCDMVLKAAGVPLDSPFIAEARKNNIPVKMSTSLFAELSPATIVGVTGTRGKSTVAAMIFEILKEAGKKTFLGGNTRGVSTLAHLPETSEDEIVVLELDSWQLQGFADENLFLGKAGISPHVSVFTTFFPDHLNYYNSDLDLYLNDKANIFKFQKEEDFLILGEQASATILSKYEKEIQSKILIATPGNWHLKIPGEHNKYNASCAAKVAQVLGIDEKTIKKALGNFSGVEGRLELIREIGGRKIYNDTTSTTPTSTVAALKALGKKEKNIILIIGGNDKGLDLGEFLETLPMFCKNIIVLPGTGSERLPQEIEGLGLTRVNNLKEALEKSLELAKANEIILFSPAFSSFSQFKNEFDRGDQFLKLVKTLM